MSRPTFADEAVVVLKFIDPSPSMTSPTRVLSMSRTRDKVPIGRTSRRNQQYRAAPGNAFIDSPVMSRDHAELRFYPQERKVVLVDVGSLHGTFANDKRLGPHHRHVIKNGDLLQFGIGIERGMEEYHPCSMRVEVLYGHLDPAQRPKIFTVPDETDIESSDDVDVGVQQSCQILRDNSMRPAFPSSLRPEADVIDLTANDKIDQSQQTDHASFYSANASFGPSQPEASFVGWPGVDDGNAESRIPTPPETEDHREEEHLFALNASIDEDTSEDGGKDDDSEQARDDDDDSNNNDDDQEEEEEEGDEEEEEEEQDDDYRSHRDEDEPFLGSFQQRYSSEESSLGDDYEEYPLPTPEAVQPVLEDAVYGLPITESSPGISPSRSGFRTHHDDRGHGSILAPPSGVPDHGPTKRPSLSDLFKILSHSRRDTSSRSARPESGNVDGGVKIRASGMPYFSQTSPAPSDLDLRMSPEREGSRTTTGQPSSITGESHRATVSPTVDLVGMERDGSGAIQPEQMDIEIPELATAGDEDSSAYQWELEKRLEARRAAFTRVSDGLFRSRIQTPPMTGSSLLPRSGKRKAREMSHEDDSEEEEFQQPAEALSPIPETTVAEHPDAAPADMENDARAPKRLRKVAEAFGFAALGGVAVMSALIATAPTL